jgi:sulfonate transport system ATP-binding protein
VRGSAQRLHGQRRERRMFPSHRPSPLSLRGVGKSYGASSRSILALRDVSLELEAGDSVAIVGGSGCGKSSLLRIIAGLERQDAGAVVVGGGAVSGPGPDRGLVFQEHRLLPWLTVRQNVAFGLSEHDMAVQRAVVEEQLALVGLTNFADAYPHQLSGGMAQRAALARALAPKPGLLLLDEPFAALDALTKEQLQEELLRLRESWRPTSLLVTHDVEEAIFLGDRVVVLSDRPGTVRRVVEVPLAHPRQRTSAVFSALRAEVLSELGQRRRVVAVPAVERAARHLPLVVAQENS